MANNQAPQTEPPTSGEREALQRYPEEKLDAALRVIIKALGDNRDALNALERVEECIGIERLRASQWQARASLPAEGLRASHQAPQEAERERIIAALRKYHELFNEKPGWNVAKEAADLIERLPPAHPQPPAAPQAQQGEFVSRVHYNGKAADAHRRGQILDKIYAVAVECGRSTEESIFDFIRRLAERAPAAPQEAATPDAGKVPPPADAEREAYWLDVRELSFLLRENYLSRERTERHRTPLYASPPAAQPPRPDDDDKIRGERVGRSPSSDSLPADADGLCRNALDHIMRVACAARQPTARLDWIAARAKRALDGKPYDQEHLPRYPKMASADQRREPQEFTERGTP